MNIELKKRKIHGGLLAGRHSFDVMVCGNRLAVWWPWVFGTETFYLLSPCRKFNILEGGKIGERLVPGVVRCVEANMEQVTRSKLALIPSKEEWEELGRDASRIVPNPCGQKSKRGKTATT